MWLPENSINSAHIPFLLVRAALDNTLRGRQQSCFLWFMLAMVLCKGKPFLLSLHPSFALTVTVRLTEIRLLFLLVVGHLLKKYSRLLFIVVLQHTAVSPPLPALPT